MIENSQHSNIKKGVLIISLVEDVVVDGVYTNAISLIKCESENIFLQQGKKSQKYDITFQAGFNQKSIDKSAVILLNNVNFEIIVGEKTSQDTKFWKDGFLQIDVLEEHNHNTKAIIDLTKDYLFQEDFDGVKLSKPDKMEILNKSFDYMKSNDYFQLKDFQQAIFRDENTERNFVEFTETYENENDITLTSEPFEISKSVIKKQSKQFKSVLKLDKNFHIYVHGNRDLINQGVDSDGRKYYKLYYTDEE